MDALRLGAFAAKTTHLFRAVEHANAVTLQEAQSKVLVVAAHRTQIAPAPPLIKPIGTLFRPCRSR